MENAIMKLSYCKFIDHIEYLILNIFIKKKVMRKFLEKDILCIYICFFFFFSEMENNVFCCLPLRDVKYEKERERIILKQLLYKYNYYSEFSIHVYPFIK